MAPSLSITKREKIIMRIVGILFAIAISIIGGMANWGYNDVRADISNKADKVYVESELKAVNNKLDTFMQQQSDANEKQHESNRDMNKKMDKILEMMYEQQRGR